MLFTTVQSLLLVIFTALLLSSTAAQVVCDSHENMTTRVNPLYYDCCAQSRQYKLGDIYYDNLKSLVDKLWTNISSPGTYFASGNVDSVSGFVLCRGDYTGTACASSLNQIIKDDITNQFICPLYKDVTIYYDQLMLNFSSDEPLYNDHSNRPAAWVASNMNYVNGTAGAGARYGESVLELINATADYAAWHSSNLYATGVSWFGEAGVSIVHGLVQCRPDLKRDLCHKCLADLISKITEKFTTSSGDHRVGGRILGVWCNLRFEKELFFEETNETRKLHMPKRAYV